jgi:hypothetical protein
VSKGGDSRVDIAGVVDRQPDQLQSINSLAVPVPVPLPFASCGLWSVCRAA